MSDDKTTTTQKMRATARDEIDRAIREHSNHTASKPDTDDLPVTKKQVRMYWAAIVSLVGIIATGVGVIVSTTKAATAAEMSIAVNREYIERVERRLEKVEDSGAVERDRVTRLEGKIDTLLTRSANIERLVEARNGRRER